MENVRKGHRVLSVLLCLLMVLSCSTTLIACGGVDQTTTTASTTTSSTTTSSTTTTSSSTTTSTTTTTTTSTTTSTDNGGGGETPGPDDWRTHPQDFKLIAFTFDDAPGANFQGSMGQYLLDLFFDYEGAATFFLIGNSINRYGWDLPRAALERGWDLGNHTMAHCNATFAESNGKHTLYKEQITLLNQMVKDELDYDIKWFRPPNMDRGEGDWIFDVTTELGMPVIGETKYSWDWSNNHDAEAVKNAILTGASDGEIVLLHVENEKTYEVIGEVLNELYNDGFRFVTLTEMFEMKGRNVEDIPTNMVIKAYSTAFPPSIKPIKPRND